MIKFFRRQQASPKPSALEFQSSSQYWNSRYVQGGTSGAGSYGILAEFKAGYLNALVAESKIRSVIELGCGDGAQLALAHYPFYLGQDVSIKALDLCRTRFAADYTKVFAIDIPDGLTADLSVSLDVIYHLVEDEVFDGYMTKLFASSHRWVAIYSSNMSQREFVDRFPSHVSKHVFHRRFIDWIERRAPDWHQLRHTPNPHQFDGQDETRRSFADFYLFERK